MSLQQALHSNILENPIQQRENLTLNRQRGKWFWRIMYAISVLLFLIPVLWGFGKHFYESINFTLGLLALANVIVGILLVVRAVTTASDSMYLERRGKTWDLLMLTGVSNWRVVLGKWTGIMRHLTRNYAWLYVIRLGTLFWGVASVNLNDDFSYQELYSYYNPSVNLFDIRLGGDFVLTAIIFLLIFTVLELMLSSAIGMAVAFFKFKAKTSSAIGVFTRVGIAILLPLILYFTFAFTDGDAYPFAIAHDSYDEGMIFFTFRTASILADNGVISSMLYANMDSYYGDMYLLHAANIAGMVVYVMFTALALIIAANRAFVRGLDFSTGNPVKVKRKRPVAETIAPVEPIHHHRTMAIEANSTNAFNIDNAETLSVDIHGYQRRLGRMVLRITGDNSPIYVQLSNVAYMEAPAFWKGANFRTASDTEYQAFVAEKGIYINSLTEDSMRLYVIEGKSSVKIVAGTAQILEELPDNL